MHPEALEFLAAQRICVFAIEMPDGAPHAATLHFAIVGKEPIFVFKTDMRYRKTEALCARESSRASLAIGFEEGPNSKTLQVDGTARVINADDELLKGYYEKFPEKVKAEPDPNAIFFKFTPTWWRFTDWSKPRGKTILTSI